MKTPLIVAVLLLPRLATAQLALALVRSKVAVPLSATHPHIYRLEKPASFGASPDSVKQHAFAVQMGTGQFVIARADPKNSAWVVIDNVILMPEGPLPLASTFSPRQRFYALRTSLKLTAYTSH